jgi:hypothetical protein
MELVAANSATATVLFQLAHVRPYILRSQPTSSSEILQEIPRWLVRSLKLKVNDPSHQIDTVVEKETLNIPSAHQWARTTICKHRPTR